MCDNNNSNNKENQENISHGIHILTDNIEGFQIEDQNQNLNTTIPQEMQQQQHHNTTTYINGLNGAAAAYADVPQILPWALNPVHAFNPVHDPTFLLPPPQQGGLFGRRPSGLQFGYEGEHHLRFLTESLGQVVHPGSSAAPFGLHAELQKMTAQEIMDAKALAASKSHSEAERRRRERINNHLAKLRSLLPSTTKTDKASLLAEVIQHVKELKRQTSLIAETSPVPTETDELTVDSEPDEEGRPVIKASICCEDRSDLLQDLIKTLKALRLRTLKAEITTLGGRVRNVLFITGDDESTSCDEQLISSIHEALKAVMEKGGEESGSGSVKRQRTNINIL
ncbi:transcription factor bHLH30-like [Salvia hispanica]|uniref:transcription factor bHLH30-like n=1 Tax=Salvia hispanica TaxID=49212 RepID=UPI0020098458|nr:transcription factor bHLH30-like [Salvia hispanica]